MKVKPLKELPDLAKEKKRASKRAAWTIAALMAIATTSSISNDPKLRQMALDGAIHNAETRFEEQFIEHARQWFLNFTSPEEMMRNIGGAAGELSGDLTGRVGPDLGQDTRRNIGGEIGELIGENLAGALGGMIEAGLDWAAEYVGVRTLEERRADAAEAMARQIRAILEESPLRIENERPSGRFQWIFWWRLKTTYYIYEEPVFYTENGRVTDVVMTSRFVREVLATGIAEFFYDSQ